MEPAHDVAVANIPYDLAPDLDRRRRRTVKHRSPADATGQTRARQTRRGQGRPR